MRIDDDDVQGRIDERRVVVAAVPEDHIGLLFGGTQNALVVDPGEDEVSFGEVRLVLLALLDRRVGCVEVLVSLEPLDRLSGQVAVRHRVSQHGDTLPGLAEQLRDLPRGLALARAGAYGADRHDRLRRAQHRQPRRDQSVRRAGGERTRPDVHHVLVRDVRVREHDLVDLVLADQLLESRLRKNGNALRIQRSGKRGRINAAVDVRDLRCGEGDDVVLGTLPVHDVEVVEVSARSADDQDPCPGHA